MRVRVADIEQQMPLVGDERVRIELRATGKRIAIRGGGGKPLGRPEFRLPPNIVRIGLVIDIGVYPYAATEQLRLGANFEIIGGLRPEQQEAFRQRQGLANHRAAGTVGFTIGRVKQQVRREFMRIAREPGPGVVGFTLIVGMDQLILADHGAV